MVTRVFIIYALEDHRSRDLLINQARTSKLLVEFEYMQVKHPWIANWKGDCRNKVRGCDGAIVLISKKTHQADGVSWELECVGEARLRMLGVHIDKYDKGSVPEALREWPVIEWNWPQIASFIQSLSSSISAKV